MERCSLELRYIIPVLNIQGEMVSPPSECWEFSRCMSDNDNFCCEEVILITTGGSSYCVTSGCFTPAKLLPRLSVSLSFDQNLVKNASKFLRNVIES